MLLERQPQWEVQALAALSRSAPSRAKQSLCPLPVPSPSLTSTRGHQLRVGTPQEGAGARLEFTILHLKPHSSHDTIAMQTGAPLPIVS